MPELGRGPRVKPRADSPGPAAELREICRDQTESPGADLDNSKLPLRATKLSLEKWPGFGKSVFKVGQTTMENRTLNSERVADGERIDVMSFHNDGQENEVPYGDDMNDFTDPLYALIDVYDRVAQVRFISTLGLDESDEDSNLRCDDSPPCRTKRSSLPQPSSLDETATMVTTTTATTTTGPSSGSAPAQSQGGGDNNNQPGSDNHDRDDEDDTGDGGGSGEGGGGGRRGGRFQRRNNPQPSLADRLRFHERTGSLQVKLSCNGRAAERMRPLDEFNNAVVMTHRPLTSDTMFEIRIDRLVEKWSGSIEVGVTTHDPGQLEFPATMTNMRSGTVMMSGCGILTNGKGTKREYGDYNLDELRVGDRIGMMRKSNGDLHYFINGLDQGIAASRVPDSVWGVVDLYGMTVKVTIVDRDEREEQNLITRRNTVLRENVMQSLTDISDDDTEDRLLFHPNCGSHAAVINNGRTAHRPNFLDDFNNAVVLTNRPLKPNEVFEVRIDKMVTKWAGSIEIGVTTHAPTELEYPSTMTNVRSGTWIMTGNGVMHNGTSVIDDYGQNLDRLQTGDRVGVVIREGGSLHFLVNGEDQGEAGIGLPQRLYAVIDLYGQATQASIVSHCPSCSPTAPMPPASSPFTSEIHFHSVHGRNARVTNGGKTASRPRATVEFNDAVVVTNRPLRPGEMFSVVVERIMDMWSGSIEAGVTAIRPDELELPGTMTDLDHDTWMLSGFAVMKDGITMRQGYPLDLDNIGVGSVVGLKRHDDSSLHYYLDGIDQGEACTGLPEMVYPVIDLYGQCAQVSIVSSLEPVMEIDESCCQQVPSHAPSDITVLPNHQHLLHKLHSIFGKAVTLDEGGGTARKCRGVACGGLVLSADPLAPGELFEVELEVRAGHWAGALAIGLLPADSVPSDRNHLPLRLAPVPSPWPGAGVAGAVLDTAVYIMGSDVVQCGEVVRRNYCVSLEWLRPPARLGLRRLPDATLHLYIDGVDQGVAAHNIPKKVHAIVDMYGSTCGIKTVSRSGTAAPSSDSGAGTSDKNCVEGTSVSQNDAKKNDDMERSIEDGELLSEVHDIDGCGDMLVFHEFHGRNIQVSESRASARRVASYNQGLVLVNNLNSASGRPFQICIESLNPRWVSSLSIGVTSPAVVTATLPVTALGLKKDSWIVSGDCVYHNGYKVKSRYGPNLDLVGVGSIVGIVVDEEHNLRLIVNGVDFGVAAANVPPASIPVLDLYGMCDQVSIVNSGGEVEAGGAMTVSSCSLGARSASAPAVRTGANMSASATSLGAAPAARMTVSGCSLGAARSNMTCSSVSLGSRAPQVAKADDWCQAEKADLESGEKGTSASSGPLRSKSDKMNENIQCSSSAQQQATSSSNGVVNNSVSTQAHHHHHHQHDAKALASTENLTLQMQQNAERKAAGEEKSTRGSGGPYPPKSPTVAVRSIGGSLAVTPISPVISTAITPCDYLGAVLRLKASLGLPNGFFKKDGGATCYCAGCLRQRHQQQQQVDGCEDERGGGAAESEGNGGWARLALRRRRGPPPQPPVTGSASTSGATPGSPSDPSTTDQWHPAFAPTLLGSVRRILDIGELLTPGDIGGLGQTTQQRCRDKKHDSCDSSQIVLSPSLNSSVLPKHQYVDPKTKQSMVAYAALEVLVRPGSYKVGEAGGCGGEGGSQPPPVEWVTKERNSTVIAALMLKLEPL